MERHQACADCDATATVDRTVFEGQPPLLVRILHEPDCEWFGRNATLGPESTLGGDVATVMHQQAGRG